MKYNYFSKENQPTTYIIISLLQIIIQLKSLDNCQNPSKNLLFYPIKCQIIPFILKTFFEAYYFSIFLILFYIT